MYTPVVQGSRRVWNPRGHPRRHSLSLEWSTAASQPLKPSPHFTPIQTSDSVTSWTRRLNYERDPLVDLEATAPAALAELFMCIMKASTRAHDGPEPFVHDTGRVRNPASCRTQHSDKYIDHRVRLRICISQPMFDLLPNESKEKRKRSERYPSFVGSVRITMCSYRITFRLDVSWLSDLDMVCEGHFILSRLIET